jgi:DNA-binding transcriptional MocR family regulator
VEDTGKLWSVSELKAGFLSWSAGSQLRFVGAFDEVMLSVSAVILLLIAKMADDAKAGGFDEMRDGLEANRCLLAKTLADTPMKLTDPDSRISVARVTLPADGPDAHEAYRALIDRGIHTLPCSRFYWARPADGDHQLRLSLSRPALTVERAAEALAEIYMPARLEVGALP